MKLLKLIKFFRKNEDAAVTVDWVVLTAAIVGLGIATLAVIRDGVEGIATSISDELDAVTVDTEIGSD